MDVDSQLGICTMWTIGDTALVIITRWIIFSFPLIIFRWISKLILLSARPHDRWACMKDATTQTAIGGSKNMTSLFGNSTVLDQQQYCRLSSDKSFLIPLKLVENVSLISVQPEFVSESKHNTGGKRFQTA